MKPLSKPGIVPVAGTLAPMTPLRIELAQAAAAFVADHGLDYGAAKTRALQERFGRTRVPAQEMPDSIDIDDALREHLDLFDEKGHRERVSGLQHSALRIMELLHEFEPLVTGAVWKSLASEQAFVHLQLFLDSSKELEYFLMNQSIPFEWTEIRRGPGLGNEKGPVPAMVLHHRNNPVLLAIYDAIQARGALSTRDRRGDAVRGTLAQLRARYAL
jgi:hypothetical protein